MAGCIRCVHMQLVWTNYDVTFSTDSSTNKQPFTAMQLAFSANTYNVVVYRYIQLKSGDAAHNYRHNRGLVPLMKQRMLRLA